MMDNDFPRITYYESEEHAEEILERIAKFSEMKSIIQDIDMFNGTHESNYGIVYFLSQRLMDLSDNMLGVRVWRNNGIVNCVVIYPNEEMKMELES